MGPPLLLLSGILLPMSLAPTWLKRLSDINPLRHVVDGIRSLFVTGDWSGKVLGGAVAVVGLLLVSLGRGAKGTG